MNSTDRTATSTNLISFTRSGEKRKMKDIIPTLAAAGYRNLDLNFCEMMNPDSSIDRSYIKVLEDLRKVHALEYVQSHVPYPRDYLSLTQEDKKYFDTLIENAISYSLLLNVRAVVIHPIKGTVDDNVDYLSRFLPLFEGTKSFLAIENMESEDEISTSGQLLEIISRLNSGHTAVCLDTGHAHIRGLDIPSEIRAYGSLLKATHIADNRGKYDEHFLPFFGNIEWENVMKAFREISYTGYFTYECMFFTRYLPREMEEDVLRLSRKIASFLISLA